MGLFDMFRRAAPIRTRGDLVDFIDAQAAFLAQKGMFEYSRARAGPYGNILFDDKGFLTALERSRWLGFALTLGMVAEAVEGVLRPAAHEGAAIVREQIAAATLAAFDRYPVPESVGAEAWAEARAGLERDLTSIGLHPVKPVMHVPARFAERYSAAMPIHEKLRAKDDGAIHNFLKSNLCNAHDVFVRRADVAALVTGLAGGPS